METTQTLPKIGETLSHQGKTYITVSRKAQFGEYVVVVANTHSDRHHLRLGDIVQIARSSADRVAPASGSTFMSDADYLVLVPQTKESTLRKGDYVRSTSGRSLTSNSISTTAMMIVDHVWGDGDVSVIMPIGEKLVLRSGEFTKVSPPTLPRIAKVGGK